MGEIRRQSKSQAVADEEERTKQMSKITGDSPAAILLNSTKKEEKPKAESKTKKAAPKTKKKYTTAENGENRTRRVQAVLPPKLYEQLNDEAWKSRQSVNETIIQAITEYLERR